MNKRAVILINTIAAVLLQAIPNTIPMGFYTVHGIAINMKSFFDIGYLWSWGNIWYPIATVCSVIGVLCAFHHLLSGKVWSRITLLTLEGIVLLCMALPIYEMLRSPERFSLVIPLITLLALANIILCALPNKETAV